MLVGTGAVQPRSRAAIRPPPAAHPLINATSSATTRSPVGSFAAVSGSQSCDFWCALLRSFGLSFG